MPFPSLVVPLILDGEGSLELRTTWPAGIAPLTPLYVQAFCADPGPIAGFSASDGLLGVAH